MKRVNAALSRQKFKLQNECDTYEDLWNTEETMHRVTKQKSREERQSASKSAGKEAITTSP